MFRIDRTRVNLSDSIINYSQSDQAAPAPREETDAETLRQGQLAADKLLAEARAEAAALQRKAEERLAEAEHAAAALRAEAERSGHESGYAAGMDGAKAEFAALRAENDAALQRVIAQVEEKSAAMLDGTEAELIDLCFAVIRKIANLDRTKDGEIFKAAIKKTLGQLDLTQRFTISLCQEDYARFFPTGEGSFNFGGTQVTVNVLEDPELQGGDILVETDHETLSAGLETQLRNIELAFRRRLGKKNEEN